MMALISTTTAEPIIAMRTWRTAPGPSLVSLVSPIPWPVHQAHRAVCMCRQFHLSPTDISPLLAGPIPHIAGTCGIYAIEISSGKPVPPYHSLIYDRAYQVVGLVALWGRVIAGDAGVFRSEYAYPVMLFPDYGSSKGYDYLALAYQVPRVRWPDNHKKLWAAVERARRGLIPIAQPTTKGESSP